MLPEELNSSFKTMDLFPDTKREGRMVQMMGNAQKSDDIEG